MIKIGWYNVDNVLPKHTGEVLTYGDDDKFRVDKCINGHWITEYLDNYGTLYWMPLPGHEDLRT